MSMQAGGLRVTRAKMCNVTGPVSSAVTWTECQVSVVTCAEGCAGLALLRGVGRMNVLPVWLKRKRFA